MLKHCLEYYNKKASKAINKYAKSIHFMPYFIPIERTHIHAIYAFTILYMHIKSALVVRLTRNCVKSAFIETSFCVIDLFS